MLGEVGRLLGGSAFKVSDVTILGETADIKSEYLEEVRGSQQPAS